MDPQAVRDLPGARPGFCNLLSIAVDALKICPPDYVRSILGPYRAWLPPHDHYSEFTMLDLWQLRQAIRYLANISVPSLSADPPPILDTLLPPVLKDLFFVPTRLLHRPDYYDDYTSYPDEKWFFINGILTNGDVAQLNAAYLASLFHRPITLIQNSTDGAIADLWECALEKEWYANVNLTEPARIAFPAVYDALTDESKDRVVIICHSQGTIIMAVLLWALEVVSRSPRPGFRPEALARTVQELKATRPDEHARILQAELELQRANARLRIVQDDVKIKRGDFAMLTPEHWDKLEIYSFATCCNEMQYHGCGTREQVVPYIEHFGNEYDVVARLGMLAPRADYQGIKIDGDCYKRFGAWGHLLNIDYLLPIAENQKSGHKRGSANHKPDPFTLIRSAQPETPSYPRLYGYINGGTPPLMTGPAVPPPAA